MKRNKILTLVATVLLVIGTLGLLNACANTIDNPFDSQSEIKKPEMVYMEGGKIMYFKNQDHYITLDGFSIGKYEVTQELYQAVMTGNEKGLSANPSVFPQDPLEDEIKKTFPVENITWYDAVYFCNELTKKIMKEEHCVYTIDNIKIENGHITAADVTMDLYKRGYRLPTEVEWQYAAQSKPDHFQLWSDIKEPEEDTTIKLRDFAWYKDNSTKSTHPVGQKLKTQMELYDIVGNVEEWCWDRYADYPRANENEDNPKGPATGSERVKRGGGWNTEENNCDLKDRSKARSKAEPNTRSSSIGLRLARSDYYY